MTQSGDKILHQLFRKGEASYAVSDVSKAIAPLVDLLFVSLFIGASGVTVMCYVSPMFMLFAIVGMCISNGARNKVSVLLGEGNIDEANRVFSASIIMGGGLSVISAVAVGIFCSEVVFVLGAREPGIFEMTKLYIWGYLIGYPFLTMIRILTPFLQMEGQYRLLATNSVITTALDISLDALVVFVLHGGMFEIALATSLGYIIPFFILVASFIRRKNTSVFRLSMKGITLKICGEIMRLGAPLGFISGSRAAGGMLINNMLTAIHMRYLVAAYGVFLQITMFVPSSWMSSADTLLAFSGVFIGEEDRNSLKEAQKLSLIHALAFTSVVTAVMFVFAENLAGVFLKSDDPEALRMASECIRVACFSLPFHAIVYCFNNYLMAVKRLRFSSVYSFLIECGNIVPIMFFLLNVIGYRGAWVSRVVSMSLLSAVAVAYVYWNGEGATFRDKMLLLPESFGVKPEDEAAVIAGSTDEIYELSHVAVAFALEHGADMKRARTYGLVTEELATFLAEHGFNDGKTHNINARLVAKGEELIIRMRDDCKPFNLTEYYKALTESMEREAGLSIIMKLSKDVQYTNTLGTNNLIVRI